MKELKDIMQGLDRAPWVTCKPKEEQEMTGIPFPPGTTLDKAVPKKSKYFSKEDATPEVLVEIAYMDQQEVEDNGVVELCPVLHFNGDYKPLILNMTNRELLKFATGMNTVDDVRGQQVILWNDETIMFGGKMTGGTRIKKVPEQSRDFDDDIPFK